MGKGRNLKGLKFGRWKALLRVGIDIHGKFVWLCECVCGNRKKINSDSLIRGRSKSCGCLKKELSSKRLTTHGMSNSVEYRAWLGAKARCLNPNSKSYKDYGGRGIKICKRWENFQNFFVDMGLRPSSKHSIERIENNGSYEPGNCRWATSKEQSNNTRWNRVVFMGGKKKTLTQWAELSGINYNTLKYRLSHGWTTERALTTRPRAATKES